VLYHIQKSFTNINGEKAPQLNKKWAWMNLRLPLYIMFSATQSLYLLTLV
jgi:hypothetical protein